MKHLLLSLTVLCTLQVVGQKTTTTSKPVVIPAKPIVTHAVKSFKPSTYGMEITLIPGQDLYDDTLTSFEIFYPDSTIQFAGIKFKQYMTYKKGMPMTHHWMVLGDTVNTKAKFAPMGSYKALYPKNDTAIGTASIAYFIDVDSIAGQEFMLPDVDIQKGVLTLGDTIEMKDDLGKKCLARVFYMDVTDNDNAKVIVPFLAPGFTNENRKAVVYYSPISGAAMHQKIEIKKITKTTK